SRVVSRSASGDTFSVTFDRGVPNFLAVSQPSPRFTSESGESVQLAGSAGLRITLSGLQTPGDPTGSSSLMPGGQELLELRKIGDAGGVVIWAVGLRQPACPTAIASGSTLTFRFHLSASEDARRQLADSRKVDCGIRPNNVLLTNTARRVTSTTRPVAWLSKPGPFQQTGNYSPRGRALRWLRRPGAGHGRRPPMRQGSEGKRLQLRAAQRRVLILDPD